MNDIQDVPEIPPDVQARRALEDELFGFGRKRSTLKAELGANTTLIQQRLPEALEHGISLEQFSRLVGISRQTLHRWKEAAGDAK